MKSQATREKFVELRASGMSYARIAETLGISKQTAISWSRDLKVEIVNLKAIEWDTVIEKHRLAKEHRVEILAAQLDKARAELSTRDWSYVSTVQLVAMILKLTEALKREELPVTFTAHQSIMEPTDLLSEQSWNA